MKDQKGITLVALVVTIIVLLILAGVTIAMVFGNTGIFTKAENAGDATFKSDAKSVIQLAVLNYKVDSYNGTTGAQDNTPDAKGAAKAAKSELVANGYTSTEIKSDTDGNAYVTVTKGDLSVNVKIESSLVTSEVESLPSGVSPIPES